MTTKAGQQAVSDQEKVRGGSELTDEAVEGKLEEDTSAASAGRLGRGNDWE
jgi:hypothetical protein